MFSPKIQAIFELAVAIALNLPESSGLKCYNCNFRAGCRDTKCLNPFGSMTQVEESPELAWKPNPAEAGYPWCLVSITYNNTCGGGVPEDKYTLSRSTSYLGKSDPEKVMKLRNGIALPECSHFSTFPNAIHRSMMNPVTMAKCDVYTHSCYCQKDWCNFVAIVPT